MNARTILKQGKVVFVFVLVLALGILCAPGQSEAKKKKSSGHNPKYASIVVDVATGEVLHESSADKPLYPASLTKLMTLYMMFERLDSGRWNYGTQIYVSKRATQQEPTKLDLREGERIRVIDAIKALVVKSANDIALAVAEAHSGTEYQFAKAMTAKARSLGMTSTTFKNASGLPDPNQKSTARDMATLSLALMRNFPHYYHFFSTVSFTYKGKTHNSHNRLMSEYRGMDGMKTGFTRASGFNLVSSAVRNNRRLIGVVFGGRTSQTRNQHMASLLDRSFTGIDQGTYPKMQVAGVPPVPARKPGEGYVVASIDSSMGIGDENKQTQVFGQGSPDYDFMRKINDGLTPTKAIQQVAYRLDSVKPSSVGGGHVGAQRDGWSIQVGAFDSRVRSEKAISTAISMIPELLTRAFSRTVPVKSDDGRMLFRARLSGLERDAAYAACQKLQDCVVISP